MRTLVSSDDNEEESEGNSNTRIKTDVQFIQKVISVVSVDVCTEGDEDMGLNTLVYYLLRNVKTDLCRSKWRMFLNITMLGSLLKATLLLCRIFVP